MYDMISIEENHMEEKFMFQILVVEDDQELNKVVCSFLNQNGYKAIGCLSAEEAYDAIWKKQNAWNMRR